MTEKCPVTNAPCTYYNYQRDNNGEVVVSYCANLDNHENTEGNCTTELCPLLEK